MVHGVHFVHYAGRDFGQHAPGVASSDNKYGNWDKKDLSWKSWRPFFIEEFIAEARVSLPQWTDFSTTFVS